MSIDEPDTKAMATDRLNISRIVAFGSSLFVLRFVVGVLAGWIHVEQDLGWHTVLRYGVLYGLDALVVVTTFARLATVQVGLQYAHAVLVIGVEQSLGVAAGALLGIDFASSPFWWFSYLILFGFALIGLGIGTIRRRAI